MGLLGSVDINTLRGIDADFYTRAVDVLISRVRQKLRPVETIRSGVARIGSGELGHRLDVRRRDEFGELAYSINAMADDIREMLEAKRQLMLTISHEIRSPAHQRKGQKCAAGDNGGAKSKDLLILLPQFPLVVARIHAANRPFGTLE